MKILQLCKKFPYPLKDGESIAVTYLSKAMQQLGHEVTLLSMNTSKHYTDISALPPDYNHYKAIHFTELDNSLKVVDAFLNLFSADSYHVSRFVCEKFKSKLIEVLEGDDYDVIQLETLYLAPYIDTIKKHSSAVVSMRAHNVEFEIWERITSNTKFWPKKWYLRHLTNKLKKYELEHLNDYDYLVAVSDRDLKQFKKLGYKNGAMASPIGLDIKQYATINTVKHDVNRIGFIGALDWMPNIEGLEWFLEHVWPQLHAANPKLEFHVAGRNTPENIANLDIANVSIHGEVPCAVEFMNSNAIMVVPLFSGSGMRVKILEGMALQRLIVTTKLGSEGIDVSNGQELIQAETAEDFVTAILDALADPARLAQMGRQAKDFVTDHYDHQSVAAKLLAKYQHLVDHPYPKQLEPAH